MLKLTTTLFLIALGMRIAFTQSLEILNEHSTTPMAFWDWKHPDGSWIHPVNQHSPKTPSSHPRSLSAQKLSCLCPDIVDMFWTLVPLDCPPVS